MWDEAARYARRAPTSSCAGRSRCHARSLERKGQSATAVSDRLARSNDREPRRRGARRRRDMSTRQPQPVTADGNAFARIAREVQRVIGIRLGPFGRAHKSESLRKHGLAVEAAMAASPRGNGENEETWRSPGCSTIRLRARIRPDTRRTENRSWSSRVPDPSCTRSRATAITLAFLARPRWRKRSTRRELCGFVTAVALSSRRRRCAMLTPLRAQEDEGQGFARAVSAT